MQASAVDLSKLTMPDVVETLDFETILAARKTRMRAILTEHNLLPNWDPDNESDPIVAMLEEDSYAELNMRQRVNDAAKACMVAYATGTDLDHIAAMFGVTRLVLSEADQTKQIAATYESDADLRNRVVLAPDGYSVAGPEGAYTYHALSASSEVLDASASSSTPGQVDVYILPRNGETASDALCKTVLDHLSDETRRPLTDYVVVHPAEIVRYSISAEINTFSGPDSSVVMASAQSRIETYTANAMRLGRAITLSGVYAALHTDGVEKVNLTSLSADIVCAISQAPVCSGINLRYAGAV